MPGQIRSPVGVPSGQLLGLDASQIQTISSGTTATIGAGIRLVLVNTGSGNFTLTCAAINIGHTVDIQKTTTDANSITLARTGAETINGASADLVLPGSTLAFNPGWTLTDTAAAARWVR